MDIEELKHELEEDIFKFRLDKEAFEKRKAETYDKIKQLKLNTSLKKFKKKRSNKIIVWCVNLLVTFVVICIVGGVEGAMMQQQAWEEEARLAAEEQQARLEAEEQARQEAEEQARLAAEAEEQARLEAEAAEQTRLDQKEQAKQQKEAIIKQLQQALHSSDAAEDKVFTGDNEAEICDYISSLQKYSLDTIELGSYEGTEYYHLTEKTNLDGYYLAESGNSTVFPGAILKGDSLFQGTDYTLLSMERTPMCLVSNVQQDGIWVDTVNFREVNSALQKLQGNLTDIQAKEWSHSINYLTSADELKLTLGVKAADVGLDFGYGNSSETSTIAVVYSQTYYTVSAEPFTNASRYFQQGTNMKELGAYAPVYVSSVDYGRKIYVFVEGKMSQQELSAAVKGCIHGVEIGADIANIKKQGSLSCTVYQYGGSSKGLNFLVDSTQETDPGKPGVVGLWNEFWYGTEAEESLANNINDFIENDAALANPVPIAYELKYLSDNSAVPSTCIETETIILKENARTVTFTLNDDDSLVEVEIPVSEGIFLTDNTLNGSSSDKVELVMDVTAPVTIWYEGSSSSIDLYDVEDGTYRVTLGTKETGSFFSKETKDIILEYNVSNYVDEVK